jgi:hypothetical protein
VKQEFSQDPDIDCSCLQLEVLVTEPWIDRFIAHHQIIIPVSDKYHLVNLKVDLGAGKLTMLADIREKEGSSIRITCLPKWDEEQQQILLEEIKIDTVSKNILLKGAGWFANAFMGAKIDKKIELATGQLYAQQMQTILKEGMHFPIPKGGSVKVKVRSITITEMKFVDHSIKVKAMIDGYWNLNLTGEERM